MSTITNSKLGDPAVQPLQRFASETYVLGVTEVLQRLPFAIIDQVSEALWKAHEANRTVYLFGNGGSAALASHCACDFGKGTAANGNRRFRVMALTDNVPLMTAWANDAHYDDIFAEQLRPFIRELDVVFAISGSGNSPNVLKGLEFAREMGAVTIGLTGFEGGKMKPLCDLCIVVPSNHMQVIEDVHLSVSHSIFISLRERFEDSTLRQSLAARASSRPYSS
jgi:D-sedoheptulose 7-phosphate isomerase